MMLKDELLMTKDKDKKIDRKIRRDYNFLKYSEDLIVLKKLKYKCTLKAKKQRDSLIITNAIAIIFTIMLSFITISHTAIKIVYDNERNIVQRIDDFAIGNKKISIDKKSDESVEKIKNEIMDIAKSEKDIALDTINNDIEVIKFFYIAIVVLIIGVIILYQIIIKIISEKASTYETLVIMIDERINEIKANRWDKAQKVELVIKNEAKEN